MNPRRVTVLMAVFNAQPYLREAIDGVLRQTYADLELIIIDDASTDDGWSVIVEAAARDSRITPLRRDRQGGASAALNQGLPFATGEFVTRQDSDDVSLPTRLAEQVAFLDAHRDIGAVGTAVTLVDGEDTRLTTWEFPGENDDIQGALVREMCFCGPTVMVRRRVLEQIRFSFDEALSGSEDYDLCLRVAEVTRLANLREPLYLYRQHPASVSRSREHEQLARKAAALDHALDRRFGPATPFDVARTVARDYVTAAVMAHLRGQPSGSPEWLARARRLHSGVLDDGKWLAGVIRACSSSLPAAVALSRIQSLFVELLPRSRSLWRLRRELTAEVHLKEVFGAADDPDQMRLRYHLRAAVRSNPLWLANRGVLSMLVKDLLARRPVGSPT